MSAFVHWRDWPDLLAWIAALATIAAAWAAAITIRQAHKIAERSADASLLERRIDHELSVLRDVSAAVSRNDTLTVDGLINMTSLRLPVTRAAFDFSPTPAEKEEYEAILQASFAAEGRSLDAERNAGMMYGVLLPMHRSRASINEIAKAARQLVSERPGISQVSRGQK